jgi:hypothetical protein
MDTFFVTSEQVKITTVHELREALAMLPGGLPIFSGGHAEHPYRGVLLETANWLSGEGDSTPVVLLEAVPYLGT